jgi:hypothetical protein
MPVWATTALSQPDDVALPTLQHRYRCNFWTVMLDAGGLSDVPLMVSVWLSLPVGLWPIQPKHLPRFWFNPWPESSAVQVPFLR